MAQKLALCSTAAGDRILQKYIPIWRFRTVSCFRASHRSACPFAKYRFSFYISCRQPPTFLTQPLIARCGICGKDIVFLYVRARSMAALGLQGPKHLLSTTYVVSGKCTTNFLCPIERGFRTAFIKSKSDSGCLRQRTAHKVFILLRSISCSRPMAFFGKVVQF